MVSQLIRAHVGIGWSAVALGACAIALRVASLAAWLLLRFQPKSAAARRAAQLLHPLSDWHAAFGIAFVLLVTFMPLTALWIWPRYGTPDLIVHLISAMYAAIAVGVACIRLFKRLNRDALVALRSRRDAAAQELAAVEEQASSEATEPPRLRHAWLKWAHGGLLLFAWIMLEGAGEAFSANARVSGFPYEKDDVSDSLHARCYRRDLRAPDAPQWLTSLACGDGAICAQSVTGGRNMYHQA